MKKQKGITLIALVITVIVLLILAGVTINLTLGERGIFTTATTAVEKQQRAEYLEKIELARVSVASENMGQVTLDDLKAQIVKEKIVSAERISEVEIQGVQKLNIITPEGYVFVVTTENAEYVGKEGAIPVPPSSEENIQSGKIAIDVTKEAEWTNQSKYVTITSNVEDTYKVQYSLDEGKTWKDYTTTFEIYENTTVWVCLRNALGERGTYATKEINKIDRDIPVITNVTPSPTSIAFSAKDEASGIVGYKVTTNTEEPTEFEMITNTKEITNQVVNVANQNTTYYVWVKDEAGNVSAYSTTKTTTQAVTKINVAPQTVKIKPNETVQLTASVLPENAFNKTITWSSGNPSIATVSNTGLVTAKGVGSTTITVTSTYGENGATVIGTSTVTVANTALASKITAANYGDYVNYPVANGSTSKGHTTDWRIFYKDNDGYVYLIASYYLPYTQVPTGTNLQPYSGRAYTSYWPSAPGSYTTIDQTTYDRYKMNYKYNGSPNNNQPNMKCVSQLMNTSVWSKFVNSNYAIDAVGAPTLEMWVESWNAKGNTKLYYDNTNDRGYYVGTSSKPTSYYVTGLPTTNTLYFPVTSSTQSDANGYHYWLASPSANGPGNLVYVTCNGNVSNTGYDNNALSVRPLVRLKSDVSGELVNGIWNLE